MGRTRYVTTDRKGNRQVTDVNGGVFVIAGVILLGPLIVAMLVVLCLVALIGLATRNERAKHLPAVWLSLWAGVVRGRFR